MNSTSGICAWLSPVTDGSSSSPTTCVARLGAVRSIREEHGSSHNSAMLVASFTPSSSTVIAGATPVLLDPGTSGAPPRTRRLLAALFAFSWSFFSRAALMALVPCVSFLVSARLFCLPEPSSSASLALHDKYLRSFRSIIARPRSPGWRLRSQVERYSLTVAAD